MPRLLLLAESKVFQGFKVDIYLTHYAAPSSLPALLLLDSDTGESIGKCTINPDRDQLDNVPDGCVAIKDWSENLGMADFLISQDVISKLPVTSVLAGYEIAAVHQLLLPTDEMISLI